MHKRHIVMATGLMVAAGLAIFGDKTSDDAITEPVVRASTSDARPTTSATTSGRRAAAEAPVILALLPRESLIGGARAGKPVDGIFHAQSWTPPPPPPPKPLPPPPPTAPPLPFTYLGKKLEAAEWEVYLGQGDKIFVVRQKTTVEGTYRVDSIAPPTLSMTYLPLNQQQTLTIGGTD